MLMCVLVLVVAISSINDYAQQNQIHAVFAQPSSNNTVDSQYNVIASPIPDWIKNNTGLWAHGKLEDSQFILGIRYIVANNIVSLPHEYSEYVLQKPIPSWIRDVAMWWADGNISDYEFISDIQYLVSNGEIKLVPGKDNTSVQESNTLENNFSKGKIKLDNVTLDVQVADTQERMTEGLQFQQPLPYNQGMIFVFEEPQVVAMWMKDMQFPLDMIWFDSSGNVIHIEKGLSPCSDNMPCQVYDGGRQDTKYVLEVTAGFVDKFNVTAKSKLITLGNL